MPMPPAGVGLLGTFMAGRCGCSCCCCCCIIIICCCCIIICCMCIILGSIGLGTGACVARLGTRGRAGAGAAPPADEETRPPRLLMIGAVGLGAGETTEPSVVSRGRRLSAAASSCATSVSSRARDLCEESLRRYASAAAYSVHWPTFTASSTSYSVKPSCSRGRHVGGT